MGQIFNLLFGKKKTKIGSITLDAAVSEEHEASSEITSNPVEDGSDIADHVRLKPFTLTLEGVISNTPLSIIEFGQFSNGLPVRINLFNTTDRAVDAYDELLRLREERNPFTVVTGLKTYDNMIIQEMTVPRDVESGNRLQLNLTLQQIEIAKSETSGVTAASLESSVSELGQTKKNLGQKASAIAGIKTPLSSTPSSISAQTQQSDLNSWFGNFFATH